MVKDLNNLSIYDTELKEIDALKKGDLEQLFINYKNGDIKSKDMLIKHFLLIIRRACYKFENTNISVEDLIQDTSLYLISLLEKIDINDIKKFHNINYNLYSMINNYALLQQSTPLLSISENKLLIKINEYIEKYESIKGTKPNMVEIAMEVGLPLDDVRYLTNPNNNIASISDYDIASDSVEEQVCQRLGYTKLKEDIVNDTKLSSLEKRCIMTTYGFYDDKPKTYKEVAKLLNTSALNVSNCTKKGIEKVRKHSYIEGYI